ncbi:Spy/CpxP family protein refolding chaperone [Bradyrhizobium elkanii]
MTGSLQNRKVRMLILASLLAATAALLVLMAAPRAVPSAELGSEWQCSKAGFVTTCRLVPQA